MSRKNEGLTLIETLVVIGIIIVLAAVITPVTMRAIDSSKTRACASQLKQIALAMELYTTDFDGQWPPYSFQNYASVHPNIPGFKNALMPYGLNDDQWYCPSDRYARTDHVGEMSHDHKDTSYTMTFAVYARARVGPNNTMLFSTEDVENKKEFAFLTDQPDLIKNKDTGKWKRLSPHSHVRNFVFLDTHVETNPIVDPNLD